MKRYFALFILAAFAVVAGVRAQGLDDRYVQIFNLIQEADALGDARAPEAVAKYTDAQHALQKLQKDNPGWNAQVVGFRLEYVADKIRTLSGKVPAPETASAPSTTPPPVVPAPPVPPVEVQVPKTNSPTDWEGQINGLKDQVRQLQTDKQ